MEITTKLAEAAEEFATDVANDLNTFNQRLNAQDETFNEQGLRITKMAEDLSGYQGELATVKKVVDELFTRVSNLETSSTSGTSNPLQWCVNLATVEGLNDEDRKNNGLKKAKDSGMGLVLPDGRPFDIATPITMWGKGGDEAAFRISGVSPVGTQNLEQGTKKVRSWIRCGAGIGMEEKALFVNPGTIFDFYLGDFAVQGGGGQGNNKQFWYGPYSAGRNGYRGSFQNIAMNFMASGFGTAANPAAFTAVGFHGQFEYLNCWPGFGGWQNIGGSDCFGTFHLNAGPSGNPLQAGRVNSAGKRLDWLINYINLSKSKFYCNSFATANNGWGALRVAGQRKYCYDLHIHGAVLEGYKPTGTKESGPAHGTLLLLEDGAGSIGEIGVGQGMAWPTAAEKSVIEVWNGDWALSNICLYKGDNAPASNDKYVPYYAPAAKVQTFGFTSRDL